MVTTGLKAKRVTAEVEVGQTFFFWISLLTYCTDTWGDRGWDNLLTSMLKSQAGIFGPNSAITPTCVPRGGNALGDMKWTQRAHTS